MKSRAFIYAVASCGMLAMLAGASMLGRELVSLGGSRVPPGQAFVGLAFGGNAPWFWLGAVGASTWVFAWWIIERRSEPSRSSLAARKAYLYIGQGAALAAMMAQAAGLIAKLLTNAQPVLVVREIAGIAVALVFWAFLRWTAIKDRSFSQKLSARIYRDYSALSRRVFLYGWSTIAALATLAGLLSIVSDMLFRLTRTTPLAIGISVGRGYTVISAIAWAVAEVILRRDAVRVAEDRIAATVRRSVRLGIAAVALAAFLLGLSELLQIILSASLGVPFGEGAGSIESQGRFVRAAALALVGAPAWWGFWWSQQSRIRAPETGKAEWNAVPRRVYLYGIVLISATIFFFSLGSIAIDALGARSPTAGVTWAPIGLVALLCLAGHLVALRGDEKAQEKSRLPTSEAGEPPQPRPGGDTTTRIASTRELCTDAKTELPAPLLPQRPIVVVIDGHDGILGAKLIARLATGLPAAILWPVGINATAQAAMWIASGGTLPAVPVDALGRAAVIIGPTDILIPGGLGGEVTAAFAAAVRESSAHKLLLPPRDPTLRWVAAPAWPDERWLENAVTEAANLLA